MQHQNLRVFACEAPSRCPFKQVHVMYHQAATNGSGSHLSCIFLHRFHLQSKGLNINYIYIPLYTVLHLSTYFDFLVGKYKYFSAPSRPLFVVPAVYLKGADLNVSFDWLLFRTD